MGSVSSLTASGVCGELFRMLCVALPMPWGLLHDFGRDSVDSGRALPTHRPLTTPPHHHVYLLYPPHTAVSFTLTAFSNHLPNSPTSGLPTPSPPTPTCFSPCLSSVTPPFFPLFLPPSFSVLHMWRFEVSRGPFARCKGPGPVIGRHLLSACGTEVERFVNKSVYRGTRASGIGTM